METKIESIRVFDDKIKALNINFSIHYYASSNSFEKIKIDELQEVSDTNTTAYFKTTRYSIYNGSLYSKLEGISFVNKFIKRIEQANKDFMDQKKEYTKSYYKLTQ